MPLVFAEIDFEKSGRHVSDVVEAERVFAIREFKVRRAGFRVPVVPEVDVDPVSGSEVGLEIDIADNIPVVTVVVLVG